LNVVFAGKTFQHKTYEESSLPSQSLG